MKDERRDGGLVSVFVSMYHIKIPLTGLIN